MIKTYIVTYCLFISSLIQAEPDWSVREGYVVSNDLEHIVAAAKQWTHDRELVSSIGPIWQYEYSVHERDDHFQVFIVKYTLDDAGKKSYYPGAHFMLMIDQTGQVLELMPGL